MKHFLRRGAAALAAFLTLLCLLPCRAYAVGTSASAAVLMDADSGRVLYAQNENARMGIASTTKIMTALVAIENGRLSDTVTVPRAATLVEGTSMYLREGEKLSLENLLYGLLLCSGNDAALAIAAHVGGSVGAFVKMMNKKAAELGMTGTSFANPNGLDDPQHYSTALDMAKLARAASENETLVRIASTRSITTGGRTMTNHNKLLSRVDGCIGLKTGYTRACGRTLVSCAVRNGQRLVAVTLQDGNDWADHAALYDYGFSAYPARRVLTIGETVKVLPVKDGLVATAPLLAARSFSWPLGSGETLTTRLEIPDQLEAPAQAGTPAGQEIVLVNGREVGRVDLICGEDILPPLPDPISLFHRLSTALAAE